MELFNSENVEIIIPNKRIDFIKKGITLEQTQKTADMLNKCDVFWKAYFMIGFPNETEQHIMDTINIIDKIKPRRVTLSIFTPYPGTELYRFALRTGRITDEKKFINTLKDARDFTVNLTDDFTSKELITLREDMMKKTRDNYNNYISNEEVMEKTKQLFGNLYDKCNIDKKDLEHRSKHGGINIF